MSERAYQLLKRATRGSRWPFHPNDLNLMGVTSEPLNILGIVRLPVRLRKGTSTMRLNFYVVSNFSLPSDGLIGLNSLKSNRMVIHPDTNIVQFQGKSFRAMENPMRLTVLWEQNSESEQDASHAQAVSVVQTPISVSLSIKSLM